MAHYIDKSPAAFPSVFTVAHGSNMPDASVATGNQQFIQSGMSLRDWFAGQALSGYFANAHTPHMNAVGPDEAAYLYRMADAMLAAREGGAS